MPSAQTLYNSQSGLNTNVLVLSTLTTPITSSAVSAVQFINAQDSGQSPPMAPYQFVYQISASGGLGSPTAQPYLMTSYDGGTTWIPCAEGTEISPGQDIVESVAVQAMGSLVAVAWMLSGTPAPSVTGRAWLISTEVFTGTVRADLTATTTYATPASSNTDATEAWVTLQLQELTWKAPVVVATVQALNAYTRSANVITANANGALPAIDGVSLAVGDRLLLKDGAAGADNGIYVVTSLGSAGTPFVLTRATDMDTSAKVRTNVAVMADQGTTQGGFRFVLTTTGVIVLNTTALTFSSQIKAPNASADADVVNLGLFQAQWAKAPVRASTTAAAGLPAYTRVANVLTANANGALPAIDGVSLAVGERVLVRNGAAGADNGIYVVTSLGSAGTTWVLTRADDYSASADVRTGDLVAVQEGTVWQGTLFQQVTTGAITLNTSTLTFTKVGGVTPAEFETSSSPYTIGLDEELLLVDSTAGNITVNLPPIATRRRRPITVANIAAANNAVVTPNGAETVMGGATRNVGARTSITLMGPRTGNDWVNVG